MSIIQASCLFHAEATLLEHVQVTILQNIPTLARLEETKLGHVDSIALSELVKMAESGKRIKECLSILN